MMSDEPVIRSGDGWVFRLAVPVLFGYRHRRLRRRSFASTSPAHGEPKAPATLMNGLRPC
jgi:hypothetical protein